MLVGGLTRAFQGLIAAAPTLVVGLFIAAVLKYYFGTHGIQRLFGGDSLLSLPQSWLVGMLLPVCSIGVIPIIREMRRAGMRPGAITAFALSAPLFNPLSLLYGLTLSRPYVIIGFALGSLAVVTVLGVLWDRWTKWHPGEAVAPTFEVIGLRRLGACGVMMARELCGPSGLWALVAVSGLFLLGAALPHGALQSEVEQLDPLAPVKMSVVSIFVYATPMLTMSQLGMMFDHANSPGAAFCLLLLGTGVNVATLVWIKVQFGVRPTLIWFLILIVIVLGTAYTIERPLVPPGIEPAGHTHAFDIYTNPFHGETGVTITRISDVLDSSVGMFDWIAAIASLTLVGVGLALRYFRISDDKMAADAPPAAVLLADARGLNKRVSSSAVGLTCIAGLIGFSLVGCYAYYPAPEEVLEEMRLAQVEVLSGVTSYDAKRTLRWIPLLEEWSRKLEVGYFIRHFELRPYQQMQAYLMRKKLELLEHAVENLPEDRDAVSPEANQQLIDLRMGISSNARRLNQAFR
jgi:uncharacterized protein